MYIVTCWSENEMLTMVIFSPAMRALLETYLAEIRVRPAMSLQRSKIC